MTTRRTFLQGASIGAGVALLGGLGAVAFAADGRPSLQVLADALTRLSPLGWRQLLLDATGGALDIDAPDLAGELAKPLAGIDRTYPGFGDFAAAGGRAVEPGKPEKSLLYHALASPTVVALRDGTELGGFPTLSEIEAIENYVYAVEPPSLDELRGRADGKPLGIVVFAVQYRNTPGSVHGRHAELCFARTGIARLGTIEPLYDARRRAFVSADPGRPFDFRVVPQRFAAYVAVQTTGDRESFGPQDYQDGDKDLQFWVPIHKLFAGADCIQGLSLGLALSSHLFNEKLKRFHQYLPVNGYLNQWRGEDLENFPFLIRDEKIGALSTRSEYGSGVLEPKAQPLVTPANYDGKTLTFVVDGSFTSDPSSMEYSSLQVLGGPPTTEPSYFEDAAQSTQRSAPEYVNIRHRVLPNGQIDNLNRWPDMMDVIRAGGYQTQHYVDFAGDGWIEAHCPELAADIATNVPAFCMVGPPDFFPQVNQRELMQWWKHDVPKGIRTGLWAVPPLALSQMRLAADITLPIGLSIDDNTVTAIVTQPTSAEGAVQIPNGPMADHYSGMPDSSPGLFDPGWDGSQGIYFTDPDEPLQKFLHGYGLGSPFVEDIKLCAALGSYWPAVAPDGTRNFPPDKFLSGISYPWPTIVPLTDEESGIVPAAGGEFMPWDGVRGPQLRSVEERPVAAYRDPLRADYLDLMGTMTAALTSRIDHREYQARILAMEAVYWSLGIRDHDFLEGATASRNPTNALHKLLRTKAAWAVLSFQAISGDDAELAEAERESGARLAGEKRYRFHMFRWGEHRTDPGDIQTVLVEMLEQAIVFVSGGTALMRRDRGRWEADKSIPT